MHTIFITEKKNQILKFPEVWELSFKFHFFFLKDSIPSVSAYLWVFPCQNSSHDICFLTVTEDIKREEERNGRRGSSIAPNTPQCSLPASSPPPSFLLTASLELWACFFPQILIFVSQFFSPFPGLWEVLATIKLYHRESVGFFSWSMIVSSCWWLIVLW